MNTPKVTERPKVSKLEETAPEEIYLQVSDDTDHYDEPWVPRNDDSVTWCVDSVIACEVKYVRADLYAAREARVAHLHELLQQEMVFHKDTKRELESRVAELEKMLQTVLNWSPLDVHEKYRNLCARAALANTKESQP